MGRVYDIDPKAGERGGIGCRVFALNRVKIPFPYRVEFDGDADEGMATVHTYVAGADGTILVRYDAPSGNPEATDACKVSFRTWVRIFHPDEPDPKPRPTAAPVQNRAGTPVPAEADEFLVATEVHRE